jgi:hypothetical protein
MSTRASGARPLGRGRLLAAVVALAMALAACSSAASDGAGADTFAPTPFVTATSDGGKLRIEARSAPESQPTRGVNAVELAITDPSGAPVDGLTLDVVPWMSAMGHGASVKPTATARGQGRYVLSNVDFFMPGRWELRTAITGPVEDHATFIVPVS